MDQLTSEPADPSVLLSRDAYYQLVDTLTTSLPPPSNDTPEERARRNRAAIAKAASLLPATAAEAELAAQFVAANAQAMENLRVARDPAFSPDFALKCRAQSASMMRQARGAARLLIRMQVERRKLEAEDPDVASREAWVEHCALGLMAEALPDAPPFAPMEPPPPPAPPEPGEPDDQKRDPISEAELYAVMYPDRAALIRRHGQVPDNARFGPPEPYLVRALVNGRTPALLALDG